MSCLNAHNSQPPWRYMMRLMICVLTLIALCGCNLIDKTKVVKTRDAPMLVLDSKGDHLLVATYNPAMNRLEEYGWVKPEAGTWTLMRFDWPAYIAEHASRATTRPSGWP